MRLSSAARGLALLAAIGSVAVFASRSVAEIVEADLLLGGRAIHGDTHSSKFEEYRDLEPGIFGGGSFLLEDATGAYFLWGNLENVGYDDQRYSLEAGQWGRLRLFGDYSELPHVFSNEARTLYTLSGSDQLLLPDALQTAIQNAPSNSCGVPGLPPPAPPTTCPPLGKSALLGIGLAGAQPTPLRYHFRTGKLGFVFDPREGIEVEVAYRVVDRDGNRPFGMGFGSPGGNFANFARPVDEKTDEVTGELRLGRGPWNLEVGYLASFFTNHLNQIIADNPVRISDSTGAASRGRISLAPENSLNSFHATGAYQLPVEFPARVTGTFAYGVRRQDEAFLPHTINSLLAGNPALVLPSASLDGKVRTYLGNALVSAQPLPELDLRARYRYYHHDNDTPVLTFPGHTINDQGLVTDSRRNVPNDYKRQQASFDAGYRIVPDLLVRGGPFWEQWSRSFAREVSELDEFGGKIALDYRPTSWAVVRADYLLGFRDGTQYQPYDYYAATLDPAEVPDAISFGQLAQLRKFDEADRDRHEVKLLAQLLPRDDLDVSFNGGWTHYDYPHSDFGAREDERWNVGTELGYVPFDSVSISLWYSYEHSSLHQDSRWRPASGTTVIDAPANDWNSESRDTVHALGASLDLALIEDKLDLHLGYTFESGNGATLSTAAAGCRAAPVTTLCPPPPGPTPPPPPAYTSDGGAAFDFPDIEDRLQLLDATLSFHQSEHLTLEVRYSWEKLLLKDYRVDGLNPYMPDSNVSGSGVVSPSLDVFLGEQVPDYDAHIFAVSATYSF